MRQMREKFYPCFLTREEFLLGCLWCLVPLDPPNNAHSVCITNINVVTSLKGEMIQIWGFIYKKKKKIIGEFM